MISDAERREVARRLRKCNFADGTSDVAEIERIDEKFAARFVFVPNLVREIFAHDTKAVFSFHEIGDRLADLIEPERETTEDVSDDYGKFECGKCGCRIDDVAAVDNGGINFCPDCGREVDDD